MNKKAWFPQTDFHVLDTQTSVSFQHIRSQLVPESWEHQDVVKKLTSLLGNSAKSDEIARAAYDVSRLADRVGVEKAYEEFIFQLASLQKIGHNLNLY